MEKAQSQTVLLDSLLHSNVKRVGVGIFSGLLAGLFMLLITSFFHVETAGRLWWLQLTASMIYGGKAFAYHAPGGVYVAGMIVHLAVAALCGFLVGKMTSRNDLGRLLFYCFVLGFLCWLSSNMFAPDFLEFQFLTSVGQWLRFFIFMSFTLSLGFMMSVFGKILKV